MPHCWKSHVTAQLLFEFDGVDKIIRQLPFIFFYFQDAFAGSPQMPLIGGKRRVLSN